MKYSTGRTFVFFGTLGWTLASVACSASTNSTGSSVANTGGNSNSGSGGGGYVYNVGVGGGGSVIDDVLQSNGSLKIHGIIRDFHKTFPDIQPCKNNPPNTKLCGSDHVEQNPTPSDPAQNCGAGTKYPNSCFIGTTLGSDSKPVYVGPAGGTVSTTGPDNFHYWFNDDTSVDPATNPDQAINWPYPIDFLTPNADGITYTYDNKSFFPIDNALFGDEGEADSNGNPHNYGFTTEFHLTFTYTTGQIFNFNGDDDLLVFINGQLVVDRSGIHLAQTANLNLDDLGLTAGQDYSFDLFYCERNPPNSDIAITTSMQFKGTVAIN